MKLTSFFLLVCAAVLGMGSAGAQMPEKRDGALMLAQYRVSGKNFHDQRAMPREPRQRRFVMPAHGNVYQRNERPPQAGHPGQFRDEGRKSSRMTRDERRALRQQINEANRGIYQKKQQPPPYPPR